MLACMRTRSRMLTGGGHNLRVTHLCHRGSRLPPRLSQAAPDGDCSHGEEGSEARAVGPCHHQRRHPPRPRRHAPSRPRTTPPTHGCMREGAKVRGRLCLHLL
ncbi:hypothetical protein E2C01_077071 [Portunus trituberculatus]|uniref:Uncharacterized protein n=1 Tax=Portunus trituberculatus TaxID=210409 RepID=A0A5B7IQB6_PORTR|nr:hypothetical protein [Portunus trituberculatus]